MKHTAIWLSRAMLPLLSTSGLLFYLRTALGTFSAPRALALMCLALVVGLIWAERQRHAERQPSGSLSARTLAPQHYSAER
ncbi:hypothetical protein [Ferrimonas balearica]|uniref:hypothetical protein n=1 Tax=Ferrimonas balearica TaxID=44012 RepID=UPI001C59BB47|nr:hypothetical protein [Ferrimonas balearica]MBW3141573.1 hypothetical protein [Ferrimonas balearica]MBY5982281.1 hypothetical protein [Ferrimonas balearica]MBY6108561.1 hypothetical protein [Ferrimonas balearica]